jgi:hypothetical protein
MDKFVANMVNGVVSGLVATFLALVIHRVWIAIILPWYEERVYHDARFEGVWDATETFSDTTPAQVDKYDIEFKRQGHQVTGIATCTDGPDKGKVYLNQGAFKNLILTLSWTPQDKTSLERGTLAAKLVANGKKFVGHGVYYSPVTEKVHTSVFEATLRPQ